MEWNEQEYEATLRQFRPRKPRLPDVLIAGPTRRRLWIGAAAAVILLGLLSIPTMRYLRGGDVYAVVEASDGPLVRVIDGNFLPVAVGERLGAGDLVRAEGDSSAVLSLRDGLRFEVRSKSEFRVEHADDGIRIFLVAGSLIVHAPVQAAGQLHVRTTDLLVSALSMSTVFLVSTEFQGSSVAVLQGEVRVQQGAMEKSLKPGEQLTSDPRLDVRPLDDAIAWSLNAWRYSLLQEQPGPDLAATRQAFDVASIRLGRSITDSFCDGVVRVDGKRFMASVISLYQLILMAYGQDDCAFASRIELLSGGPEWLKSEKFDVQALMPRETGTDTQLQEMLKTLLEDRFKLIVRRETKDLQAYALTIAKGGHKLRAPKNGGIKASLADLALTVQDVTGKPVLDRTGLKGEYDYHFAFASLEDIASMQREKLLDVIETELGLRLESITAPVEFLFIERLERPSAGGQN